MPAFLLILYCFRKMLCPDKKIYLQNTEKNKVIFTFFLVIIPLIHLQMPETTFVSYMKMWTFPCKWYSSNLTSLVLPSCIPSCLSAFVIVMLERHYLVHILGAKWWVTKHKLLACVLCIVSGVPQALSSSAITFYGLWVSIFQQ